MKKITYFSFLKKIKKFYKFIFFDELNLKLFINYINDILILDEYNCNKTIKVGDKFEIRKVKK